VIVNKRKYRSVTNSSDEMFAIRLPLDLKRDLELRASLNSRRRNNEIAYILGCVTQYKINFNYDSITIGNLLISLSDLDASNSGEG
jgi:hypothetical protein